MHKCKKNQKPTTELNIEFLTHTLEIFYSLKGAITGKAKSGPSRHPLVQNENKY